MIVVNILVYFIPVSVLIIYSNTYLKHTASAAVDFGITGIAFDEHHQAI